MAQIFQSLCLLQDIPNRRAIDRIFHGERTAQKLKDMNQNVDIFEATRSVELKALSARRQRLETMLRAVTMSVLSKNYDISKIGDAVSPEIDSVPIFRDVVCLFTLSFCFPGAGRPREASNWEVHVFDDRCFERPEKPGGIRRKVQAGWHFHALG